MMHKMDRNCWWVPGPCIYPHAKMRRVLEAMDWRKTTSQWNLLDVGLHLSYPGPYTMLGTYWAWSCPDRQCARTFYEDVWQKVGDRAEKIWGRREDFEVIDFVALEY